MHMRVPSPHTGMVYFAYRYGVFRIQVWCISHTGMVYFAYRYGVFRIQVWCISHTYGAPACDPEVIIPGCHRLFAIGWRVAVAPSVQCCV